MWRDGREVDGWVQLVNIGTHDAHEVVTVIVIDDVTIRATSANGVIKKGEGIEIDYESVRDPVTRDVEGMLRISGHPVATPRLTARVTWRTQLGSPRFQFVTAE